MGSQESIYWTFLKNLAICFEHMAMDAEDIVIFSIIKSRSINIPTLEKGTPEALFLHDEARGKWG